MDIGLSRVVLLSAIPVESGGAASCLADRASVESS